MTTTSIGRLERVPLREAWRDESQNFTPWLAQPENIRLLADELNIELEVDEREKRVGPYRADIVCRESRTNATVLIENQLERTDHRHLGQLITYAAGTGAVIFVWIASEFTDEHRAALDWLNELGNQRLRCFGVEMELWRIGASPVAPRFNVVVEPNEWSRTTKDAAEHLSDGGLSDTRQLQLAYWTALASVITSAESPLSARKPRPENWMNFKLGASGMHLAAVMSTFSQESRAYDGGEIRAEFYLDHPDRAKEYFARLEPEREAIEREFGEQLTWANDQEKKHCKIYARRPADVRDAADWQAQHTWLVEKLERLHRIFSGRAKALADGYRPREEMGLALNGDPPGTA